MKTLAEDFVVLWENNYRESYVGYSSGYSRSHCAVGTTNGAGGHNVQLFVLAPDGVVLHALGGFWHPDDLLGELGFAKTVARLWADERLDRTRKERIFRDLHDRALESQSHETTARSGWQGFDDRVERARWSSRPDADTILRDDAGQPLLDASGNRQIVPLNMLTHLRMRGRPFRTLDTFDVASFVDYGRYRYDNNPGRGRDLPGQDRLAHLRRVEARREVEQREKDRREAEREAARAERRAAEEARKAERIAKRRARERATAKRREAAAARRAETAVASAPQR